MQITGTEHSKSPFISGCLVLPFNPTGGHYNTALGLKRETAVEPHTF